MIVTFAQEVQYAAGNKYLIVEHTVMIATATRWISLSIVTVGGAYDVLVFFFCSWRSFVAQSCKACSGLNFW